jgi:hypothetical protein
MNQARWILACLAGVAAVLVAGCQPTATTGSATNTSSTEQAAGNQPAAAPGNVKTVVLNAKGMH